MGGCGGGVTGGGGHTVLRRGQRLGSAPALNVNVCAVMFRHLCLVSQPDGLDAPCASRRAEGSFSRWRGTREKGSEVHFIFLW